MITAVIAAAGSGARTGLADNKIFYELDGLPVICRTISAFSETENVEEILVACRKEDEERLAPLLRPFGARMVTGGETRFESVYNALKEARGEIVLIHDGARPFVTQQTISACVESVKKYGSGICAVPASDTVAVAENGAVKTVPDRKSVYCLQTPQGFLREELLCAYERARAEHKCDFTDDSGVYGRYIRPPRLSEGDRNNIKLTYPEDFPPHGRVGFGVDTHAFYSSDEGVPLVNFITLGGIRIPSEKILKAHSDGDVLVHALMDALLSAAGLRDIGYYFPDTDKKYAGADSTELLKEALARVRGRGLIPYNVSISVLAETPRLSPHIDRIKQNLSLLLSIPEERVAVAAGTNEKLGYVGEKRGITVYAYVKVHEGSRKYFA